MKVQELLRIYSRSLRHEANADVDSLIGMKVQGITPQYVDEMHVRLSAGHRSVDWNESAGITPRVPIKCALGFEPDVDQLIGMVQGITPEYVHQSTKNITSTPTI